MSQTLTPEQKAAFRAQALGSRKVKSKIVMINGVEVELRQQSLAKILSPANDKLSQIDRAVLSFIDHAYFPGTDERIFAPTDLDVIKSWPFDKEWIDIQTSIAELSGIRVSDVEDAEKDLTERPLD